MLRMVISGISLLGLVGCQTANTSNDPPPAVNVKELWPDPAFKQRVYREVAVRLKDPESARFGPMRVMSRVWNGRDELVVCGWMNAKNSFGGYVGRSPYTGKFFKNGDFELVAIGDSSQTAALMVLASCRGAGIPIS